MGNKPCPFCQSIPVARNDYQTKRVSCPTRQCAIFWIPIDETIWNRRSMTIEEEREGTCYPMMKMLYTESHIHECLRLLVREDSGIENFVKNHNLTNFYYNKKTGCFMFKEEQILPILNLKRVDAFDRVAT